MRTLCLAALLAALVLGGAGTAAAAITLKKGDIVYDVNGKKGSLKAGDIGEALPVSGAQLVYFELNEEQAAAMGKKEGAILFFDKAGTLTAELPGDESRNTSVISASPKGDVLAVDDGTWVVRSWTFFAYPSMKPLQRSVAYLTNAEADITWADNNSVIVTTLEEDGGRQCGYDPCGPKSVELYRIQENKRTPLFAGTGVCDYSFASFDGKTVKAKKICAQKVADWNAEDLEALEKSLPKSIVAMDLPAQ